MENVKNIINSIKINYNAPVILTFFIISFIAFILNIITNKKSNDLLFSNYRSSIFNPLTYIRLFTHTIGHQNWEHFKNNFIFILLLGPILEEKYGSIPLLKMILLTAFITSLINIIFVNHKILGASGIAFMFKILISIVNLEAGFIPLTLVLVFIFFVSDEIISTFFKKDNVSHISHLIGAICGCIYGFLV